MERGRKEPDQPAALTRVRYKGTKTDVGNDSPSVQLGDSLDRHFFSRMQLYDFERVMARKKTELEADGLYMHELLGLLARPRPLPVSDDRQAVRRIHNGHLITPNQQMSSSKKSRQPPSLDDDDDNTVARMMRSSTDAE